MTRPDVAIVTPNFPPHRGGIQTVSYEVARETARRSPTVVLAPSDFDASGEPFRFHRIPRGAFPRVQAGILRALLRLRPRRVLVMHWHHAPAALAAARVLRAPLALVAHATEVGQEAPGTARHRLMTWAFRRADRVVAPSPYSARLLAQAGVPPHRVRVVPWAVDGTRYAPTAPAPGRPADAPLLLTVSSLDRKRKNHEAVLDLLATRLPRHHYWIAGDGEARSALERRVADLGLAARVRFLGNVPDADMAAHYSAADAFVLPGDPDAEARGDAEGFGLVFLEAAACGTPSVAYDIGGVHAAIHEGETGHLAKPGDPASLADALHRAIHLSRTPETRARIRAKAVSRTWGDVARELWEEATA